MAIIPMPVMTSAIPPTMTATVAAAVASPRCAGARLCAPRARAPAEEAARIGRRLVIGDGLYAEPGSRCRRPYTRDRMPYELPPDPSTERHALIARWVGFAFAAVLVALVTYFGYIAYEGSRQLADSPSDSADCRTPALMGWAYEEINYDIGTDAALEAEADPTACAAQAGTPGDAVTGPRGVALAGWYVPAANGIGPGGPTVILT